MGRQNKKCKLTSPLSAYGYIIWLQIFYLDTIHEEHMREKKIHKLHWSGNFTEDIICSMRFHNNSIPTFFCSNSEEENLEKEAKSPF